ncbi:hypothetical protein GCM10009618_03840 [Nesterenkonia lacusekhoensis]
MVVAVEILCAVLAAAMFGAGHYMSGTASRRRGPVAVAYWTQFGVVAVALTLLLAQPAEGWDTAALLWGGAAAGGGVVGSLCLYAALSRATFTLAVGASTVTTTVTPALVALVFLGEQASPLRLVLVALSMLTVWLLVSQKRGEGVAVVTSPLPVITGPISVVDGVSQDGVVGVDSSGSLGHAQSGDRRGPRSSEHSTRPGAPPSSRSGWSAAALPLAGGLGYAVELVGVAQIPQQSFTQGLAAWAVVSLAVMLVIFMVRGGGTSIARRSRLVPRGRDGALVVLAGGFSAAGMMLFHLSAAGIGLATTSAVVAVYPAVPILLAVVILRERPSMRGWAGLACAAVVVGLGALSTLLQG